MAATFTVLFIHGPAAAGKHTVGSRLAELSGLPLFHNHLTVDLVSTLFEFGSDGFVQLRADIWKAAFRAAAIAKNQPHKLRRKRLNCSRNPASFSAV